LSVNGDRVAFGRRALVGYATGVPAPLAQKRPLRIELLDIEGDPRRRDSQGDVVDELDGWAGTSGGGAVLGVAGADAGLPCE
jgi:hypothetical protein